MSYADERNEIILVLKVFEKHMVVRDVAVTLKSKEPLDNLIKKAQDIAEGKLIG